MKNLAFPHHYQGRIDFNTVKNLALQFIIDIQFDATHTAVQVMVHNGKCSAWVMHVCSVSCELCTVHCEVCTARCSWCTVSCALHCTVQALVGQEVIILRISAALTTRDKRLNVNCEDAISFIVALMTKSTENDNMV